MSGVRIGIDFDNTIICYDKVFAAAAHQSRVGAGRMDGVENRVREYLRSQPGGELAWQGLQGWVYGKGIGSAEILSRRAGLSRRMPAGRIGCLHRQSQDPSSVIRIRTAPTCGSRPRDWLRAAGLIGSGNSALDIDDVYFEDTQAAKVERLASLNLDVFIDDLADVFEQPHFPRDVRSILFDSSGMRVPAPTNRSQAGMKSGARCSRRERERDQRAGGDGRRQPPVRGKDAGGTSCPAWRQ